jgi:hypothetical protein
MNTPYSEIYELFLLKIVRDKTFFIQTQTEVEQEQIAEIRMKGLLNQAIYNIVLIKDKKNFDVNFFDKDDVNNTFLFELYPIEKGLIADYMFENYVSEDYVDRWQALKQRLFTDDEIKVILNSPANSLKEFHSSIRDLKKDNESKVRMYLRRNRKDLKYKSFNYDFNI